MITAPSNSTRFRLLAGFGLVVALSAAVRLGGQPVQIGSPVAPAEPALVTGATATRSRHLGGGP